MANAQATVEGIAGGTPVGVSGGVTTSPTLPETELGGIANGANLAATVTFVAPDGALRNYVTSIIVDGLGATAAGQATLQITGLLGGTLILRVPVPAGITVPISRIALLFPRGIPASAPNIGIQATLSAFGAGNTNGHLAMHGFTK